MLGLLTIGSRVHNNESGINVNLSALMLESHSVGMTS